MSDHIMCEVEGCNEPADVYDVFGNYLCFDCMNREIEEEGSLPEEYQTI